MKIRGAIFDLDGVIVDTAKYHYLAWKRLAKELGFVFTEEDNERLKGVSRKKSLEILLEVGNLSGKFTESEEDQLATKKNSWYVEYIGKLKKSEIMPGTREFLQRLRVKGIKISLGSASKNAPLILERLEINELFDEIVDGTKVSKAKPNPEVFITAAKALGIPNEQCVVFEDAQAGIEAGNAANMYMVAIGKKENLRNFDEIIAGLFEYKNLKIMQDIV